MGGDRVNVFAFAKDRDAVRDLQHFVQFVRDENDRLVIRLHRAHDFKQFFCFLRGQYGSRLVQDKDVRSAVECLDDLDCLFLRDRHVVDFFIRVDLESVFIGNLFDVAR